MHIMWFLQSHCCLQMSLSHLRFTYSISHHSQKRTVNQSPYNVPGLTCLVFCSYQTPLQVKYCSTGHNVEEFNDLGSYGSFSSSGGHSVILCISVASKVKWKHIDSLSHAKERAIGQSTVRHSGAYQRLHFLKKTSFWLKTWMKSNPLCGINT